MNDVITEMMALLNANPQGVTRSGNAAATR